VSRTDRYDIGFTGTRFGANQAQLTALYAAMRDLRGEDGDWQQFHHGCCIGADLQAARLAVSLGYYVVGHPPTDTTHLSKAAVQLCHHLFTPEPYLARNQRIVECVDHLVAAPLSDVEELRCGTWSTVRKARKMQRPVTLLLRAGGAQRGERR